MLIGLEHTCEPVTMPFDGVTQNSSWVVASQAVAVKFAFVAGGTFVQLPCCRRFHCIVEPEFAPPAAFDQVYEPVSDWPVCPVPLIVTLEAVGPTHDCAHTVVPVIPYASIGVTQ